MTLLLATLLVVLLAIAPVLGDSLADIEHVVIFMQENRSWNSVCMTWLLSTVSHMLAVLRNNGWRAWLQ